MTAAQRVELMEALWKIMSANTRDVEPPEWHAQVLEARERAIADGKTSFIDWNEAKAEIFRKTIDLKR